MKRNLAKVLAAVMLVGGMTVNVNADDYSSDEMKLTDDTARNTGKNGTEAVEDENESGAKKDQELKETAIDVKLKTDGAGDTIHVYGVSIDVSELTYNYSSTKSLIWNPNSLAYEYVVDSTGNTDDWSGKKTQTITVTNYSDLPIYVTATDNVSDSGNGVSLTYKYTDAASSSDKLALGAAFSGDVKLGASGTATNGTIDVTINGTPIKENDGTQAIGQIMLKVIGNPLDFPAD